MGINEKKALKEELEQVKKNLKDLEKYLREFSDFLPLAVSTVNPIGITININKAFEKLTGYQSIEIVGEPIELIFSQKKRLKKLFKKAQEKEKDVRELTLISKQKKKIPVKASFSIREDRKGNFIGYFIALTNIAEIKKLQKELEEKVKERTKEIEEVKKVLEIKIQARNRELRELAGRREEIIKERTKQLREKVDELERFYNLAVGRELKMVELKKENKKLKEKREKYKK